MPGRKFWCSLMVCVALFGLLTPVAESAARKDTRMIEASAYNASSGIFGETEDTDRKQIDIEESGTYVSHSVLIVSANPRAADNQQWSYSDGVVKGEDGKVRSVWVEVKARNKGLFDEPVWVRAQLTVIVEESVAGTATQADTPSEKPTSEGATPEGSGPGSETPGDKASERPSPERAKPEGMMHEGATPEKPIPEGTMPESPTSGGPVSEGGTPERPNDRTIPERAMPKEAAPGGIRSD
ncbi:MAG: hypothetical protein AAGU11_02000 [Syntrophobacteraceae bacterium]